MPEYSFFIKFRIRMIDNNWYYSHLKQIKEKAGPQYTPELNIDLPISSIFDGLSKNEKFYDDIRQKYGELINEFRYVSSHYENNELQSEYNKIKKNIDDLLQTVESIKNYDTNKIPWNTISTKSEELNDSLWEFSSNLRKEKEQVKHLKTPPDANGSHQQSPAEKIDSYIYHIRKTTEIIGWFNDESSGTKAKLSNHPFLLVTGKAGRGKTHLLCDIAENRIENNKNPLPTFLIFGEYFSNQDNFWNQVSNQLQIECKKTKNFLKELNDIGKNNSSRSIIIIDAINENFAQAPDFWKKNLDKVIDEIKQYPNIALVISVRLGFESEILTTEQRKFFIEEEHQGFQFREWEAANKFFKEFKLPLPEIPMLMPEFKEPLFLLLFCKAFEKRKNKRKKQIFRGHEGATYIFESFILNSTEIIADKFKIKKGKDPDPKRNVWNSVIKEIAKEMISNQNYDRISEEKLNDIILKSYPDIDSSKFSKSLEENMLIIKVPRYTTNNEHSGFDIKFPFQKFSDHLIGRYIFNKYEEECGKSNKNLETAKKFFSKRRKIGKFLSKSWNRGIIEALSIQCPERLNGIEFIDVAPYLVKRKNDYLAQLSAEAFIDSIVWRNPKSFSKDLQKTRKIINQDIIKIQFGHDRLLNAFLSVSSIPNHPFNAEFLHRHLSKLSMPKRDSWWSTFLHYEYGREDSVDRLLKWSWSDQDKSHISDDSIFLASITLSWFLTTPNRFIRDKATKGLVCLMQDRIHLILDLIEKFYSIKEENKDLYVNERLFAVAYGCVLRNQDDKKNLRILAEWVYENLFKNNKPPVHILLRDYALGIIKTALIRNINLNISQENIDPPYKSNFPAKIPSEEELKKKYYPEDFFKNRTEERGFCDIWFSVMDFGDFARYKIGTNNNSSNWSGRRLSEGMPNRKKILEQFKEHLSENQRELLQKATNRLLGTSISTFIYKYENKDKSDKKHQKIKQKQEREKSFSEFEKSLQESKKSFFKKEIKPFLDDSGTLRDPLEHFDLSIAQRWIFNRVVELGYNPKLHGEFDKRINDHNNRHNGRSEHKSERVGKKYQWIAYHEFMALLADNFEFKGDIWDESSLDDGYKGTWNPFIRDIDPSFILPDKKHLTNPSKFSSWISARCNYNAWKKEESNENWVKITNDLPDVKNIIRIEDDENKEWLILEGYLEWEEKTPPEHKKYDIPVRQVWYMIKSYIIEKKYSEEVFRWAKKQNFMGRWMPQSHDFYEAFLGEYPNHESLKYLRGDHISNIELKENNKSIPSIITDDSYLNEFTIDCSLEGSLSIKLPCRWLTDKMNLNHNVDGRFYDNKKNLIAENVDIEKNNFSSKKLLIHKKPLTDFLEKHGYMIFWSMLGKKQLIGGSMSGKRDFTGRLEISGAYKLKDETTIVGKNNYIFTG